MQSIYPIPFKKEEFDLARTFSFFGISQHLLDYKDFYGYAGITHTILRRLQKKPAWTFYDCLRHARKKKMLSVIPFPKIYVRVDDFPGWYCTADQFDKFHNIFAEAEIPYALGVTPLPSKVMNARSIVGFRSLSKTEINLVIKIQNQGVTPAQHGIHHFSSILPNCETGETQAAELNKIIEQSRSAFREIGIVPKIYIPPYNGISPEHYRELAKYFSVICTGPETVPYCGALAFPAYIKSALFLPSYMPLYGKAADVLECLKKPLTLQFPVLCITLHWEWEKRNNFADVKPLCEFLHGRVLSWDTIL